MRDEYDNYTDNGRSGLHVPHPSYDEPQVYREARVLRHLRVFLEMNGDEISDPVEQKLHKTINTRLITVMNEVRDAKS